MRIACQKCGATLGEVFGELLVIRHRQRLVIVMLEGVRAVSCWRCHEVHDDERIRVMVGQDSVGQHEEAAHRSTGRGAT